MAETRKTVTAVFCDVVGSTEMGRRLDAEVMRGVMEQYFAAVSAVLTKHGGTVEKFVGDAVMAVFGVPVAHEDDALRACRAAVEILSAVAEVDRRVTETLAVSFGGRIGVETGEVVVGDTARGSTFASGAAVNTAARLEQTAGRGECLIGPECYRLVRTRVVAEPVPGLALKGMGKAVDAYRLLQIGELDGEQPVTTALIGRAGELVLLRQAFNRAATDRMCQLVTVLGPAGIGKSRLAAEFVAGLAGKARVLRGRCVSYGEGITYWPLVEVVRQAANLSGSEALEQARDALADLLGDVPDAVEVVARIAPVAGLGGTPGAQEDTAWAVQRLLGALAADLPVVLVVDDLHWAEPGLVDLVEAVCDSSRDAPILVAVFARPEFLDEHPGWGAGRVNSATALLEPLSDEDVDSLMVGWLDGEAPGGVAHRVREAAGGNPLFVEHLLAMLVEDGSLRRDGSHWQLVGDLSALRVPPTINALLTARLDLLPAQERAVLGPAAVIGQVFYRAAVSELSTVPDAHVSSLLRSLVRKGLLRPTRSDLTGQGAMRFGHALIRDAAYGALPKAVRADLHERFARWLDVRQVARELEALVGNHLEAAFRNRTELGEADEATRGLAREAAQRLAAAGTQLLGRDDGDAAALLQRADALRTDEGPDRWALQIELAGATFRSKGHRDAAETTERVLRAAEAAGDRRWEAMARIMLAVIRDETELEGAADTLRRVAMAGVEQFTAAGDHYGLSVAHQALGIADMGAGHWTDGAHHLTLGADHAELAGRPGDAQRLRLMGLTPLVHGDCPADRGFDLCRRAADLADHRAGRARALSNVAFFATLLGHRASALDAWDLADELTADLRAPVHLPVTLRRAGCALATGDWVEAVSRLEQVCDLWLAFGDLSALPTDAANLAHALLHTGQVDDARRRAAQATALATSDDVATHGLVYAAQSCLAAHAGDREAAKRQAALAAAALPEEMLLSRALIEETCALAAEVLGDEPDARTHRQRALELHRAKGNLVSVSRLQDTL